MYSYGQTDRVYIRASCVGFDYYAAAIIEFLGRSFGNVMDLSDCESFSQNFRP